MNTGSPGLMPAARIAVIGAAALGATGIALAAAEAHLGPRLLDARHDAMLRQGIQMQVWDALALLGASVIASREHRWAPIAVAGLLAGTVAFCVGVDLLAIWRISTGPLAPAGGTMLILSWGLLGIAAWRAR